MVLKNSQGKLFHHIYFTRCGELEKPRVLVKKLIDLVGRHSREKKVHLKGGDQYAG